METCTQTQRIVQYSDLRSCPYQTKDPEKISAGGDGIVCRISEDLVAKMPFERTDVEFNIPHTSLDILHLRRLVYDYKIAKILEQEGILVANPKGIFNVDFRGTQRPAYVMDYLDGDLLRELPIKIGREKCAPIERRYEGEISRAQNLGFLTHDSGDHNAIWVPKTDKVHLIDFSRWSVGNSSFLCSSSRDQKEKDLQERLNNIKVER